MAKVQSLRRLPMLLLALSACTSAELDPTNSGDASVERDADTKQDGSTRWPPNEADATVTSDAVVSRSDAGVDASLPREELAVPGGDVMGTWCGDIIVLDAVTVPSGETLEVCAGTTIAMAEGSRLRVDGTLKLSGTNSQPIRISGTGWLGLVVGGTLDGVFTEVRGAGTCVKGNDGGQIMLHDSYLHDCGQTLNAVNGAHMDRTIIEGGTSVAISGGVLKMTDSIIDLMHDTKSPDCTKFNNASVELSHVHFTGCHCPLHFNSGSPTPIVIEDSVFDGATYPVMVAKVSGRFARNHFEGTASDFLDIGGSIDLDIADNYFGGEAPDITGGDVEQFKNRDQYRAEPVPGVGPR